MNDLIEYAKTFAIAAHAAVGQKRKYTGEPYHVHCMEVAWTCLDAQFPVHVVAAALLHDVLEDTKVERETLKTLFGEATAQLVEEVTDVSRPEDGNRAARKAIDREHMSKASYYGKTIKLADMLSNSKDIADHDPKFARTYLPEMVLLLPSLEGGNRILFERASAQVLQLIATLDKCA
jgi:(p)ppGpp synthase/HD superfamily hydrolase